MSIDRAEPSRPLPDRPNLRHLKDQAKDLLKAGVAASITDAQFRIARLYGFASWSKLKAHIDSLEEIGQLLIARGADLTIRARVPGHYERPGELLDVSAAEYGAIFPLC